MKHLLVSTLLVLTLLALPASAEVSCRGNHAAQALALVSALPPVLQKITAYAEELSEKECKDANWDEALAGCAWKESRRIQMRSSCWAASYFVHELGHQVWWQLLSPGNRSEWKKFWQSHLKEMGRAYARSSSSEGFAECFALTYVPAGTKHDVYLGVTSEAVKTEIRSLSEGHQYDAGQDEPEEVKQ